MMIDLEESLHTLMSRKNLRSAHIINKSYIVHRKSYIANAFSNAVALAVIMLMALKGSQHTLMCGLQD